MGIRSPYQHRCYWCKQPVIRHRLGGGAEVWVHHATNIIWCATDGRLTVAWPRYSKIPAPEVT